MKRKILLLMLLLSFAAYSYALETKASYLKQAKAVVKEVSPSEAYEMIKSDSSIYLLNVCPKDQYDKYHIKGSYLIPRGLLEFKVKQNNLYPKINKGKKPALDQTILVYCTLGGRGLLAGKTLKEMGYANVINIKGGLMSWMKEKLPIEK